MSIHAGGNTTCIINGLGQRLCAGNNQFGQFAKAGTATTTINTSPALTVIPAGLAPAPFAVPAPFVSVTNAANAGVCTLLLSVKVDATCDASPPVFNPPLADISADATSAAGAVVTFDVTADKGGVPVAVTCTPASGSTFAIGDTTVTCQAGVTTGTFVVGPARARLLGQTPCRPCLPCSLRCPNPCLLPPPHRLEPLSSTFKPDRTPPSQVSVAVAAPSFAANAPTEPFEATTATPFLGAVLTAAQCTPRATDAIDGDLSSQIQTFLADGYVQITLSGPGAYTFPLGSTAIINSVTNSFGVTADESVTIVVRDTTPPVVAVAAPGNIAVVSGTGPVNYTGKVRALVGQRTKPRQPWSGARTVQSRQGPRHVAGQKPGGEPPKASEPRRQSSHP